MAGRSIIDVWLALALLALPAWASAAPSAAGEARIVAALDNLALLERPGEIGLATISDGNKFVQCRRLTDRDLYCEAAGTRMQPSLAGVLTPDRVALMTTMGWRIAPLFGLYAQTFPARLTNAQVADLIIQALQQAYDADVADLEVMSDRVAAEPCPPRNGPRQALAGMINDAPSMAPAAVHAAAIRPCPMSPGLKRPRPPT
jgi:hypothetical protein